MEAWLQPHRVRFSGVAQDSGQDPNSTRERGIPPQKTSSFKGDRKKQNNWFRRQFTSQTSRDYDSEDGGEYATVIAAAALAIKSLEEAELADKKNLKEGLGKFPTKAKSKKEEGVALQQDTSKISRRLTIMEPKEDEPQNQDRENAYVEKSERVDQRIPENAVTSEKKPEKAPSRVPTIKRAPTTTEQADTQPRPNAPSMAKPAQPKLIPPTMDKPTFPTTGGDEWKGGSTRTGPQSKADAWMEAEMEKIKTRSEKLNSTILSWEEEKKKKARRQLNRKESEVEQRRARALEQFRNEMTRIDQIVRGAKAQVEERQLNEELKAKEKVDKIRATGKVPSTGFCC
ncbi:hypothetical protein NE237_008211 [Protea cynaroides]|uniref:Remorin C-terminal domain-containing protein n=1 Tax=Protea cynaroides TaxID=273540 RepID=A0A9Q0KQM1_9MAGN|nr:hypothetical protein NE237_008211 [Protea cynaroides]